MSVLPVTAQPKAKTEEPKFAGFARTSVGCVYMTVGIGAQDRMDFAFLKASSAPVLLPCLRRSLPSLIQMLKSLGSYCAARVINFSASSSADGELSWAQLAARRRRI